MTDQPTANQSDQTALVQAEMLELFMRLEREGITDWRVAMAGAASAIASVVMQHAGAAAVPAWFERMAEVTHDLARPH